MTHIYEITGMTCGGCVAKAKNQLLKTGDITEADLQLEALQATISMQKHIHVETLQEALNKAGNYTIMEANGGMHHGMPGEETKSWVENYKPILVIFAYITVITALIEIVRGGFEWEAWMRNFMAAFFLVFSFFKMLDVKRFAESYFSYDIIAKRWMGWGYVYAFIELGLGLAYLLRFGPLITNIGVLQSVLNKRKIKCACLGAVFNLPMRLLQ